MKRRYYRRRPAIFRSEQPFFSSVDHTLRAKEEKTPFFHKKGNNDKGLTIGRPGDKYEQEAEAMASAIEQGSPQNISLRKSEISGLQRMDQDESIQAMIQLVSEEEPEIQSQTAGEEEEVQMQTEEEETQLQAEEENAIAPKSEMGGLPKASQKLSEGIRQRQGQGQGLATPVRKKMEHAFGFDFGDVIIHTDQAAVQMNRDLQAQAFTHGNDIYFNSGKYNPNSSKGRHLLAHELTHVVQQRKPATK